MAYQRPPRPTGIAILAILEVLGGLLVLFGGLSIMVIAGSWYAYPYGYGPTTGLFAAFGGILFLLGILSMAVGWGMWSGKGWSWTWGVVLYGIGIIVSLFSINYGGWSNLVSLFLYFLILWYITRPGVQAYFGRGATQASGAVISQPRQTFGTAERNPTFAEPQAPQRYQVPPSPAPWPWPSSPPGVEAAEVVQQNVAPNETRKSAGTSPQEGQAQVPQTKTCANCGAEMHGLAMYCRVCGAENPV